MISVLALSSRMEFNLGNLAIPIGRVERGCVKIMITQVGQGLIPGCRVPSQRARIGEANPAVRLAAAEDTVADFGRTRRPLAPGHGETGRPTKVSTPAAEDIFCRDSPDSKRRCWMDVHFDSNPLARNPCSNF
jgi:hypothetical protein